MSLENSLISWASEKGYTDILDSTITLWKQTGRTALKWDGSIESAAACLREIAQIAENESSKCAIMCVQQEALVEEYLKRHAECCEQLQRTCASMNEVTVEQAECQKLSEYYSTLTADIRTALQNAQSKEEKYEEKIRYAAKWAWVPGYGTYIGVQALVEDYWAEINSLQDEYNDKERYLEDCVSKIRENSEVSDRLKGKMEALTATELELDSNIKQLEYTTSYYKNNEALFNAISTHFDALSNKVDSSSYDYDAILEEMGALLSMNEHKTKIEEVYMMRNEPIRVPGKYRIYSILEGGQNRCLDVENVSQENGAPLILFDDNGQANQNFFLNYVDEGYFSIEAEHSGKVLDIEGGKPELCARMIQFPYHGGDNQLWKIQITNTGTFVFESRLGGLVLDIAEGSARNGTGIISYSKHGGANQQFVLKNVAWE